MEAYKISTTKLDLERLGDRRWLGCLPGASSPEVGVLGAVDGGQEPRVPRGPPPHVPEVRVGAGSMPATGAYGLAGGEML